MAQKDFFRNKIIIHFLHVRTAIQRVSEAQVIIDSLITSSIAKGLLVLVGIEDSDTEEDIIWLSNKIVNLRIFDDENTQYFC